MVYHYKQIGIHEYTNGMVKMETPALLINILLRLLSVQESVQEKINSDQKRNMEVRTTRFWQYAHATRKFE